MEKQYDHKLLEKTIQTRWDAEQTYHQSNNPGPAYTIDTPPPTVSGSLHIGHIFSYTQTDIVARYKRMQGFSVFYPFGFDDNGLPTERFVEKKHNIIAHNLTRSAFIDLCLQETIAVEKQFEALWRQMGLSVDWSACYSTIESNTRKISQESFIRLFNKGYAYRKDEPALYCMTCRTTVSQAELDDKEVTSFFYDIRFTASDGSELLIGTSRPELLFSCVAVFYNPNDPRYQHLKGQQAIVPLYNFQVPILADESVRIDKGTGLVYCATFGDTTDIEWFKKFKLPLKPSIGLDGKWLPETGPLAGLRITAAREKMVQELKNLGVLVNQQSKTKNVNVHERCKKEIEYVILPQWFLTILDHKKTFIDLADQINWFPTFMKSRYQNWVENISWDWCISRQRFFGIPFPAWHCTDCKTVLLPTIDQLPIDPQETPYPGKKCTKCHSTNIVPDTDVMDTWNTSSLTPYLCLQLSPQKQQSAFEPASKF
jgi:valyl-tRNA synthetase